MASPNLGIPDIQDSDQPEIEANAAKDLLDEAMNDNVQITVTGAVTVTLAQYNENRIIKLIGTPGAAFNVFLPANKREFVIWNTTGQTATIGVDDLGGGFLGSSQTLVTGKLATFLSDTTNVELTGGGTISIKDDSIEKVAAATAINFTGPGVVVTDGGGGQADVDIQGGAAGVDSLLTTSARGAIARNNANQSLTTATWTALLFQLEDADTDAFHDTSTNTERMTIPAGVTKVRLKGNIRFAANATGIRQARITRNGATDTPHSQVGATANATVDSTVQVETAVLSVVAGDFFELEANQDSGGALNVLSAGIDTWFAIEVVETSDTVDLTSVAVTVKPKFKGAVATKSADELTVDFGTAAAAVAWDAEEYDTDDFHDNSTNNSRLTVPAGVSRIQLSATVNFQLITASEFVSVFFRKNGSNFTGMSGQRSEVSDTNAVVHVSSPVLNVIEGDYFEVFVRIETDTSVTLSQLQSHFNIDVIEEVGAGTQPTGFIAVQPLPRGAMVERTATQAITTAADVLIPTQTIWERKSVRGNNYWLGPDFTFVDGDVSVANDTITEVAHGMETADGPLELSTDGTLPAGLATVTAYFAIRVDNDTFKLATSIANALANSPVDITAAAGGGTHTVERETRLVVPDGVTKVRVSANAKWDTSAFVRTIELLRNGAADANAFFERTDVGFGEMHGSAILAVTPGDYFELQLDTSTNTNVVAANTWFMIEAVEEAEALSFPGVTVERPHLGCLVDKSASQSIPNNTDTKISFNQEFFDTGYRGVPFHDNATNNTRITIPAGVTKIKLEADVSWDSMNDIYVASIQKNGGLVDGLPLVQVSPDTVSTNWRENIVSAVVEVVEGDFFEVNVLQVSGGALNILGPNTWFAMTVIETEEAAFPPEEVATVEPLANGAALAIDTIEYAKVAVRRFSLFDDFAGSVGAATTAPTGTTSIFDVKRNGTIIGTITFAISATTATFVTTAAIEEVFEVGDILTIETQGTVNTVIRGISFSLWAWRS